MTDRNGLLAAALDYAAQGVPVFFLGRTKRPVANCPGCPNNSHDPETCECLTCHGFYAATTNPDRIHAMRDAVPRGLLAIRTGAASGRLVVDIDPRNGGRLDPALMPPTAAVATGNDGWHLHYRHPGFTVPCGKLAGYPGVDIKADGGYVVVPPSTHPDTGRMYRHAGSRPVIEVPPPLLAACLPPAAPATMPAARPNRPTSMRAAGGISSPSALLAANLDAVRRAPQGRRRTTLYGACKGVARIVAAGALNAADARAELTAVGREAGQTDRDIHAAITAAFRDEGVPL